MDFQVLSAFHEMEVSGNDQVRLPKDGFCSMDCSRSGFLRKQRVGEGNGIRDLGPWQQHSHVSGSSRTVFECAEGL
jgi:hypothetical protein